MSWSGFLRSLRTLFIQLTRKTPRKRTRRSTVWLDYEVLEERWTPVVISFGSPTGTAYEGTTPYTQDVIIWDQGLPHCGGGEEELMLLDSPDPFSFDYETIELGGFPRAREDYDYDYTSGTGAYGWTCEDTIPLIHVPILEDELDEYDSEAFQIEITNLVNADAGTYLTQTVSITDNDDLPGVSFTGSAYTAAEDVGQQTVTVMLDHESGKIVYVDYKTIPLCCQETDDVKLEPNESPATEGDDYNAANGTLSFFPAEFTLSAGETSKSFDVGIRDDSDEELDEALRLNLLNPTEANLVKPYNAKLTIRDNDASQTTNGSGKITSKSWSTGGTQTYTYNGSGFLTAIQNELNQITTFTRDASGNKLTEVDPFGNTTTFTYNAAGQTTSITRPDPDGAGPLTSSLTTYAYDAAGRLTGVTNPDSSSSAYTYDANGNLTATTDELNHTTTYTYNAANQLIAIQDALGQRTTFSYADGVRVTTLDTLGRLVTATYDSAGHQLTETRPDPDGAGPLTASTTTWTYDGAGHRLTETDPLGQKTTWTYDSYGRTTSETRPDPDGAGPLTMAVTTWTYATTMTGRTLQVTDPLGRLTTSVYDKRGQLVAEIDALGNRTTSTYDLAGRLVSVTDALNHTTTYVYDAAGRQTASIDPLGNRTTSVYDNRGRLLASLDPLAHRTTFLYDNRDRQTAIVDALGKVTTTVYDAVGNVTQRIDPLGHATQYTFDALNRPLTTQDALSNVTTTVYDAVGNVIAQIDALGRRTTTSYDAWNRRIEVQNALGDRVTTVYDAGGRVAVQLDPLGKRTTFSYDAQNRQVSVQDALGNRATTVYDGAGNVLASIDELGNRTTYNYDAANRRTEVQDALGNRATTVYDAVGNVFAQIDPLGHRSTFSYDAANRQVSVQNALGNLTTTVYDAAGNQTVQIDALGRRTTFSYDALNRQIEMQDALGNRTTTVYDDAGHRHARIDALGHAVTFSYDAVDRVVAVTDPLNHTTTLVYDAVGNLLHTIDPLGFRTTYAYDALNRQMSVQDPAGGLVTSVYDALGRVTAVINQLGNRTTHSYDALGRETKTTDALGGVITMLYDARGQRTGLIDPVGNRTTFVYDALGRQIEEKDPLGNSITMAYDAVGRLTSQTDRLGRRREFSYDDANRTTREVWKATGGSIDNTLTFTYDAVGNQLTALDQNGAYTMSYDVLNRVDAVQEPFNQRLTFGYDAVGNRTLVQDSFGGVTSSIYDAANRLMSRRFTDGTTSLRIDLTYTNRDQTATETRYSDLSGTTLVGSSEYTYAPAGDLTNLQHKNGNGTLLANYTYTYDLAHRVLSETLNGSTTSYQYDVTNQLTQDGTTTYTYDLNGNRTMAGYQTGTGNRVTNDGVYTYTYDAAGNLTKKSKGSSLETWEYGYDQRNQMTWAEKRASDGGTLQMRADYKYDVNGNRIEMGIDPDGAGIQPQNISRSAYLDQHIWAALDGVNAMTTRYGYTDNLDDIISTVNASGAASWYLSDRIGSVRDITDSSGTPLNHIDYTAFGAITSETNPTYGSRHRWTARERDIETGLQYNRARHYDVTTGRWSTEDPIRFLAGDANLYRYAANSPTLHTDPQGLASIKIPAGDWIDIKLNDLGFKQIKGPPSFSPKDIANWLASNLIGVFSAPGDLVTYIGLSLLKSKLQNIYIEIGEANDGCNCTFLSPITLTSMIEGLTTSEIDLTGGTIPKPFGILVPKIGVDANITASISRIDKKAKPPVAYVSVGMILKISFGPINQVYNTYLPRVPLTCGQDNTLDIVIPKKGGS